MKTDDGGELDAIASISRSSGPAPEGEIWIGDDAAVIVAPKGPLLFATDSMVSGVHFTDASDRSDVGWTALVRNVSDLAAMGGRVTHAVVSVTGADRTTLDALYDGIAEAARVYDCAIVGGDLSDGAVLVVTVAVVGTCDGRSAVLRSGANAGDALYLTGALGASAAGLRLLLADSGARGPLVDAHRRPRARSAEGRVAAQSGATAMVDVSDGLGLDLHRLADASSIGFALDRVPVAPGASEAEARGGGEEYELLFAMPDDIDVRARFEAEGLDPPLRIGHALEDQSERTCAGAPLPALGWRHSLGSALSGAEAQFEDE